LDIGQWLAAATQHLAGENLSILFDPFCGHPTLNLVRKRIQMIG
jgi:hypothetical protein